VRRQWRARPATGEPRVWRIEMTINPLVRRCRGHGGLSQQEEEGGRALLWANKTSRLQEGEGHRCSEMYVRFLFAGGDGRIGGNHVRTRAIWERGQRRKFVDLDGLTG